MPFKPVFESSVNEHMTNVQGEQGEGEELATPRNEAEATNHDTKDIKSSDTLREEEDVEISAKKERPPRFSTLFEPTTSSTPQVIERYIEAPEKRRRSGVYLPTPVFVVLALVLFFESTLLFAYTMIGLYNNAPRGLLPFGGGGVSATMGCDCPGSGAGVNIAPNFYMAGATPAPDLPTTFSSTAAATSTSKSTTTSSSSSSSSSTANLSSILADLRSTLATSPSSSFVSSSQNLVVSTTEVVVSTPKPKIVSITSQETVIAGQATSTSTKVVGRRGIQTMI